jgi:hypothetical protein
VLFFGAFLSGDSSIKENILKTMIAEGTEKRIRVHSEEQSMGQRGGIYVG